MPSDESSLPLCSSSTYYKKYFDNCNVEANRIAQRLPEKKRKAFILQRCCQEVACKNPSILNSQCVDYKPPNIPHFGRMRNISGSDSSETGFSGIGIL